jgi:DNA-binding NarL/FixJ family response regulator
MADVMIRETGVSITDVLGLIAAGYSYKQVLETHASLSLGDIMLSAKVARELVDKIIMVEKELKVEGELTFVVKGGQFKSMDELKKDHPRAFDKWTEQEHADVERMFKAGDSIKTIAEKLQRSYGSIKARLIKLELLDESGRRPDQAAGSRN